MNKAADFRGRVLLLVTSSSYRAEDFLSAAEHLGVPVTVASDHDAALSDVAPGANLAIDFSDPARAVSRVVDFHREYPLAAIVAAEDEGTVLGAAASARLGLCHNPVAAVQTARRKDHFREALLDTGIHSPRFTTFGADEAPESIAARASEQIGFPCVVKPVSLAASRGVIRADDEAGLATAFQRVVRIAAAARGLETTSVEPSGDAPVEPFGDSRGVIIEGYVPGVEVALEGLIIDGELRTLAVLDKPDPLEGPYFEETMFITPSRLPVEAQEAIRSTATQVARAIGLEHGPVHAEMRVNEDGVWPIEMAPRSIGGLCSRLFRFRTGRTLEELILLHAIGAPLDEASDPAAASGAMMIPIPRAGRLVTVEGTEAALAVPAIEDVVISLRPGQEVVPLPEGNRYLGFIFARSEEGPEAVEAALREAHGRLSVTIE